MKQPSKRRERRERASVNLGMEAREGKNGEAMVKGKNDACRPEQGRAKRGHTRNNKQAPSPMKRVYLILRWVSFMISEIVTM